MKIIFASRFAANVSGADKWRRELRQSISSSCRWKAISSLRLRPKLRRIHEWVPACRWLSSAASSTRLSSRGTKTSCSMLALNIWCRCSPSNTSSQRRAVHRWLLWKFLSCILYMKQSFQLSPLFFAMHFNPCLLHRLSVSARSLKELNLHHQLLSPAPFRL